MSIFSTATSNVGAVAAVTVARKGYRFTTTCREVYHPLSISSQPLALWWKLCFVQLRLLDNIHGIDGRETHECGKEMFRPFIRGWNRTTSMGAILWASMAARCSGMSRRARIPPCTPGCRVFTRPVHGCNRVYRGEHGIQQANLE